MTQQVVTLVDVQAPADTAALARLLNPIVPTITAESLGADLGKSDGKPITAVALREQDVEPVRDQLAAVPGVELVQQTRLLTVDRRCRRRYSPTWPPCGRSSRTSPPGGPCSW